MNINSPGSGISKSPNGSDHHMLSSVDSYPSSRTEDQILLSSKIKSFSFTELKNATRNFRPDSVLGEGGFGCVFKGWIDEHTFSATKPGLGMVIAVKKLNQDGLQGHKEWLAEVNYLGQLQHPNLVKLVGYCVEDDQRLLVYEFMPKGSLENHLFRRLVGWIISYPWIGDLGIFTGLVSLESLGTSSTHAPHNLQVDFFGWFC